MSIASKGSIFRSHNKLVAFCYHLSQFYHMRMSDNIDENVTPDFMPRSYPPPIKRLLLVILLSVIVIQATSHYSHLFGGMIISSIIASVIIVAMGAYAILARQNHNDMMMATEFENLLFASAASLGTQFCIFIKQDGTIVYANEGTYKTFPRFSYEESRALDALLQEGQVEKVDADRIYAAMSQGKKEKLIFPITRASGERCDFILILEPLTRPSGYFVIRGRIYAQERKDTIKMPDALRSTSVEKLGNLIQSLPFAIYVTSASGTLEFVNSALEHTLGYEPSSLVANKATLNDIIHEAQGYPGGEFVPSDYEGEVLLKAHNGSLIKANMKQIAYRNENQKIDGCSAIIEVAP